MIFPEGTRTPPGEKQPYHPGIAALYKHLALPVVPVAPELRTVLGKTKLRQEARHHPGRSFLNRSSQGLERRAFMAALEEAIETATATLIAEAEAKDPGV